MDDPAESVCELTYFRGRVALSAILHALGVGAGDEVALQAYTCVAVPEAILNLGARPLYVDIEPQGYGMDPEDFERKITSRTRAVVVQHTFGIPAAIGRISEIAAGRDIALVEDCAHSLESSVDGRTVGSFGIASFYSFEWGKPVVAGIGGSAVANDPTLVEKLRKEYEAYVDPGTWRANRISLEYWAYLLLFRPSLYHALYRTKKFLDGLNVGERTYHAEYGPGVNSEFGFRMASSSKRRLRKRLSETSEIARHSQWVTAQYRSGITSPLVEHPRVSPSVVPVYARYPLASPEKARISDLARKQRVEIAGWYDTPVHPLEGEQLGVVGYQLGMCPNAETRAREVFHLPTHRRADARYVDRALEFFVRLAV